MITKKQKEMVEDVCESLEWKVVWDEQTRCGTNEKEYIASFYKYSPAGEDFGFDCYYDDLDGLVHEVYEYYVQFDQDEHVEMWIEARRNGRGGIPSIKELVKDAEDIDKMLEELWLAMDKLASW